jgi:hypothetical protein
MDGPLLSTRPLDPSSLPAGLNGIVVGYPQSNHYE